ncbi:MAG: redoxin domain-containing protein, partial [candidate division Zixibacteria bacterium]|nr:redoxin domain-containing protein [candidate division Zixibacteria bacterium]
MSAVAGKLDEFKKLGVEILSISTDSTFTHKIWDETELSKMTKDGIPWPMVADGSGNLGKVYGVYDEANGVDIRGRFLIDPDGVIQAMEVLTPPVGRKVDESIRQVQAFQHVRKTKGAEACPAGWEPGKQT